MGQTKKYRLLPVVGLLTWVLLPLVMVAGLSGVSRSLTLDDDKVEVWVPVGAADQDIDRGVDVILQWSPTVDIVSPAWSGVVQRVNVTGGASLSSGHSIALVDGVTRIAAHTSIPFHRQIDSGLRGEDVRALNEMLRQLGHSHAPDDAATWQTTRGIRQLGAALGAGSSVNSFDPAWIVYLPYEGYVVGSVQLAVGKPAPAPGETILGGTARITSAELVTRDSVAIPPSSPSEQPGAATRPTRIEIANEARVTADPEEAFQIAGVTYELDETRSRLAVVSLPGVEGVIAADQVVVRGQLVRQALDGDVEVPSAGIVTDATGAQCVRVDPDKPRWVAVDIRASRDGLAVVSGSLSIGEKLQVGATVEPTKCS
ncbi:hypothetical protein [Homoserinimonas hongtaonis]|uniref:hypothetical protein n=1 Tax=Homoserinimonas hongtaonis TaxID=2079791 RepID=UPI001304E47A|nr:hypothetical protein [Salinibacterium hongtaonis]